MNFRYFIQFDVLTIGMIVVFLCICLASTAHCEQLSQQQVNEMVMNRELIAEYRYYSDNIIGDDRVPRVRVFHDGLVLVYYPVYMKRAGYYTLTLTPEELKNFVELFGSEGFFQFNEKKSLEQIFKEKKSLLTYQSHSMHTEISAHPAITQAGIAGLALEKAVTVHWKNINVDVQQYGDSVIGLKGLYRISQKFDSLIDRACKPK